MTAMQADILTVGGFFLALVAALVVNIRDYRNRNPQHQSKE